MTTVNDQIEHEKKYAELSAQHYYLKQDQLRVKERGDEVDAARSLMRQRIAEVGCTIAKLSESKVGIGGKYNRLLRTVATFDGEVDFDVLAYLGIQTIFQQQVRKNGSDWINVATKIGNKLEFEHKTAKFEKLHPGFYYTVMKSMQDQQVSSYSHIRNVLSRKMTDFEMSWDEWPGAVKVQLANKILLAIMHNMDDVFFRNMRKNNKGNTVAYIDTTPLADEWMGEFESERGYMTPARLPTLIEPRDWVQEEDGTTRGGYYSYRLATQLVKTHNPEHRRYLRCHDMKEHINAINKMQKTAWQVNLQVLSVQKQMFAEGIRHPGIPDLNPYDIPEAPEQLNGLEREHMDQAQLAMLDEWKVAAKATHRANRARKGKVIQFKMAYDVALQYQDREQFYFVYTADFRGRVYAETTGLSPQGDDASRSLLKFAKGKPCGQSGLYWLAVHGANLYGIDKVSFEERVDWIYEHTDRLTAIANDPIGNREWWGSADKPWQFLAFVYAWAKTAYGQDPDTRTSIPVGLDGSCNGLQHYSAMLRDPVGGAAVNLSNSEVPADIYQQVSDKLRTNLSLLSREPMASLWLRTGLGRKLAKRPVMTLPYGSTQTSARRYIFEWALDNRTKFPDMNEQEIFQAVIWLTPHLWGAMKQVIIAATTAMSWIQSRATQIMNKTEDAITWITPVGFPVYQPYVGHELKRIDTRLSGGIRIQVNYAEPTETICRTKQRSGIAPNFVHSLDSSHMVKVINASDFDSYAMIHDDFGTHAADVGEMWRIIREEFVKLYWNRNILEDWSKQQGEYTGEYPEMGTLDVLEVMNSEYFFS